ncbi:MAG: hypothetical protein ACOCP9_02065 [Halofilum sp. (in: g-proteobacteria)]
MPTASIAVLAGVLAAGSATAFEASDAALASRVGHAFELESGRPLYREVHSPEVVDGALVADEVEYVDPDGRTFARKRVSFEAAPLAPSFRLEDTRTGYIEALERRGDGRIELIYRKREDAATERTVTDPPQGVVADAGFDLLIYRNLDRLRDGETLRFPFAAASQQKTVPFRLRAIDEREVLGEPALVIRMEPDNMFIRWLANPIDVAYHAETGALLRYEGLSNIPDPDGDENYRVRIDSPPEGMEPEPPASD